MWQQKYNSIMMIWCCRLPLPPKSTTYSFRRWFRVFKISSDSNNSIITAHTGHRRLMTTPLCTGNYLRPPLSFNRYNTRHSFSFTFTINTNTSWSCEHLNYPYHVPTAGQCHCNPSYIRGETRGRALGSRLGQLLVLALLWKWTRTQTQNTFHFQQPGLKTFEIFWLIFFVHADVYSHLF